MDQMGKTKTGVCVFCGNVGVVTADHVPPRGIFPNPQPNGIKLITVPACEKCNGGSSKEDEEFKLFTSFKSGMDDAHCLKLHESAKRTLANNGRLKCEFQKNSKMVHMTDPFTGLLTPMIELKYDAKPILKVTKKIIYGLHYHCFKKLLPQDVTCIIILEDMLTNDHKDFLLSIIEDMKISGAFFSIGKNDEFACLYSGTEVEYATSWLLMFNKKTYVWGLTFPPTKN